MSYFAASSYGVDEPFEGAAVGYVGSDASSGWSTSATSPCGAICTADATVRLVDCMGLGEPAFPTSQNFTGSSNFAGLSACLNEQRVRFPSCMSACQSVGGL